MVCHHVRFPAQHLSDVLDEYGPTSSDPEFYARRAADLRTAGPCNEAGCPKHDVRIEAAWWWMCGSPGALQQCVCGTIADYACDYPMAGGKTCDRPLCEEHRFNIGTDLDLCLIHHAEFRGKAGVSRINDWPPAGLATRKPGEGR